MTQALQRTTLVVHIRASFGLFGVFWHVTTKWWCCKTDSQPDISSRGASLDFLFATTYRVSNFKTGRHILRVGK